MIKKTGPFWVGVDIGGTKIDALVVDAAFNKLSAARRQPDISSDQALVASITETIRQALQQTQVAIRQVAAIGVGIPGRVLVDSGEVLLAANLNLENYPLGNHLSNIFKVPFFLDKDVYMAAIEIHRLLNQKNHFQNLAYFNIGTGISAGLVLNGSLYRGQHGMAGEIGHAVVDDISDQVCRCGNTGCLETLAAGPAIARYGRQAIESGAMTQLTRFGPQITAQDVFDSAAAGDPVAKNIVQKVGSYLGLALQNFVMAYDVGKIIIGGGISLAGNTILSPILEEWDRQKANSPLAAKMLSSGLLELSPANLKPGLWGAALAARERFSFSNNSGNSTQQPESQRI